MQTSECFQVDPDLFSHVGPRLVLHTPCGGGQWIHIVGEQSPGQCAGKIDSITGPKFFALVHISSICFVQDKPDERNRPKYLKVGTVYSVWPLMVIAGGCLSCSACLRSAWICIWKGREACHWKVFFICRVAWCSIHHVDEVSQITETAELRLSSYHLSPQI